MGKKSARAVAAVVCAAIAAACARPPSDDPELLLTGGVIYTSGSMGDPVEAIAIRGNAVLAAGSDAEILQLAGPYTQEMPLEDSVVLPGTYDAWVDLEALGRWSTSALDLRRASSVEEVQAMVRNAVGIQAPRADPIVGWGWDQNDWPEPSLPGHTDLDTVEATRPVILYHRSGLMAWVNGAALADVASGRSRGGGDALPSGTDVPAGILLGDAVDDLDEMLAASRQQRSAWVAEGARIAAAAGITRAATPPADTSIVEYLLELEFRGLLPLRVDVRLRADAVAELAAGNLRTQLAESELVQVTAVGVRLDGPLSARLAALQEPYAEGVGLSALDLNALGAARDTALQASLPLHVHASGDAAIAAALEVINAQPAPEAMIIGFDLLPDDELRVATSLDVAIAAARFTRDIYFLDRLLGEQRARRAHAWKDLAALGGSLAFASDAPAFPLRPLTAAAAAVTRQDADGYPAGGWNFEQALPRDRLVGALFANPATGSGGLGPGDAADLVVWSEDPILGDPGALRRAEAMLTIVAGRVAYSRAFFSEPAGGQSDR